MARRLDRLAPLLLGAALCISVPVQAREWQVQPDLSVLAIRALTDRPTSTDHQPFAAVFDRWQVEITFDPGAPTDAFIRAEIDMTSLASSDTWGLGMARGADWLAVETFPTATWTAQGAVPLGRNRYRFDGTLRLRDVSAPLSLNARVLIDGPSAVVSGAATLSRHTYGVGAFAAPEIAAVPVEVTVELSAIRAP